VGMTPADSGTTKSLHPHRGRGSLLPGAPPVGDPGTNRPDPPPTGPEPDDRAPPAIDPVVDPEPEPELDPGHEVPNESRSALRAARRRRRRLSIVCAVLIALCTALTLLIVAVARDRTPGPQVVTPTALFTATPLVDHHAVPELQPTEILGASAPLGGHP
jgi:hypothetical protein